MGLFKNNIIIAVIALIVISGAGFYYISRAPDDKNDLLVSESATGNSVDRELLASLLELKSLKFNPAFLESTAFKSLKDFSREIPDEPKGRPNPFAPIGSDKAFPISTSTPR